MAPGRDHGGGLDAAVLRYGGTRADWVDLSTGINPVPYPVAAVAAPSWTDLPDIAAQDALLTAARCFWHIPDGAAILAAPGASALIARLPGLAAPGRVDIPAPTYNEHAAGFAAHGWTPGTAQAGAKVIVHPNNPTGHWYGADDLTAPLMVIDESFADVAPERSLVSYASRPGHLVLKSFGKFWGLAGLRLGFAIGPQDMIDELTRMLGPWPVSGPALAIGARALNDFDWASETRQRLSDGADRLDQLMMAAGAEVVGGTTLFRLYKVSNADLWQDRLARHQVWSRVFPYADDLIRLGLPAPADWPRLEAAL